jgi:hypothetical protein
MWVKYLRAANITPEGLDLTDLLEIDFTPAERAMFSLQVGDVLLTEASGSAAQVGRTALWRGEIDDCCYQNTVIRFRPHLALPEYALVVFRRHGASGVFARAARGVGIQHLAASGSLPSLSRCRRGMSSAVSPRQPSAVSPRSAKRMRGSGLPWRTSTSSFGRYWPLRWEVNSSNKGQPPAVLTPQGAGTP